MDDTISRKEHARTLVGGLIGLVLVAIGIAAAVNGSGTVALIFILGGVAGGLAVRFLT